MDYMKLLNDLREEQARLNDAVAMLQRLVADRGTPRRGRPPKWLAEGRAQSSVKPAGAKAEQEAS